MPRVPISRIAAAVLCAGIGSVSLAAPALANPGATGLVISEAYVNGGSSGASYLNKFVELFNPTASPVALTGDTLQYRAPTSTVTPSGAQVFALSGTVAAHGHFLIQLPSNNASTNPGAPLPTPDLSTGGSINPGSGGGTLFLAASTAGVLPTDASVLDKIGWGTSNSPEGTAPTGNSVVLSYQRDAAGTDTDNNATDFSVAAPTPQNAASDGGSTGGGTVTVTSPGTLNATVGTAIAPVTLAATGGTAPYTWTATGLPAGLAISTAGVLSGTPTAAGTSSVTATATDSAAATGSVSFTVQVVDAAPTTTPIAAIQGTNTDTSPLAGQTVTTEGVVTAAYPTGGFNGFFLETGGAGGTAAQDATPGASDAVFVFGSISAGQVTVGESVRVTGKVSEFQGETEIGSPTVTQLDTPLPAVVPDQLPWSDLSTDAQKESHEGELIAPQGDFTVSDNYDANWYGSFTLAAGDTPLRQPTDVGTAGSPAAQSAAADDAARMITLDDGSSVNYSTGANANTPLPWLTPTNPVSVGAKVTFHKPLVLDYRFSLWNLQPTAQVTDDGAAVATFSDTRTGNAQPATVGGGARLATFNVENYFSMTGEQYVSMGLGTCTYYTDRQGNRIGVNTCTGTDGSPGPRGAANDASFARQQSKIVTGINRLGASIVSLEEVENSSKFGEPRDTALAGLVGALNAAAGSNVWEFVPSPPDDQLPPLAQQDVIRTAFIYKPAAVSLVGVAKVLTGDSADGQPFSIAREPLAQGFKKAGATDKDAFLVVANHLKSKGADATGLYPGDAEDTSSPAVDQGAFNATRVHQVTDMSAFATQTAAALGTNRIFLLGDFNAYTGEDPMQVLYGAGYVDLGSTLDPAEQTYSYNSLEGSLDHVLANPAALTTVTGADVWQINAQEAVAFAYSRYNYNATQLFDGTNPFAASDHDPVVVGLTLPATPLPAAWSASKVYNAPDTVTYNGSTWQAMWWTQNQTPGDPNGPWEQIATAPDGIALWTASRVFNTGDVAEYQGKKYVAKWWTRNQVPGDPNGPWKLSS
ncbi:ExeM/NucH family extracellular endonuclease [Frankia sp. AgB1.9]|uniref:ExeM/NucH family extracellular endonuclease n=1 Tax=unclassified Frankia TaxID=2632575 RepID=UPI001933D11A|nr:MULTISPECIES: ExeM/NucH family extracellular endonuclease [unclassified Frankia]MBL7490541.1 ExeM/NucH family extracellular endonuclease [Frankia sp. AgW1.1]MBL7554067.1 ExeM/NucH family extracellular endonuclease [Frankia sp. AgB1.9]MBL7618269.1 ExeM/NucH family extracellular endonuclease [Frankia sp. AgB1.8]